MTTNRFGNQVQVQQRPFRSNFSRGEVLVLAIGTSGKDISYGFPRPFASILVESKKGQRYHIKAEGRLSEVITDIQPGNTISYTGKWIPSGTKVVDGVTKRRAGFVLAGAINIISREPSEYFLDLVHEQDIQRRKDLESEQPEPLNF